MLTGIVKLAQIDDYISPSQNCVQPKIMKKDVKEQKATVTLNDCLACSGCITSAQSVLIQQMSIEKFMQFGHKQGKVVVMVSPQSLLSLAKFYGMRVEQMLDKLESFMKNKFKSVVKIYQMSLAIQICHELILQQFLQKYQSKSTPILCSECPGWVCYSQKTLTQKITDLMSTIKSPQQIMSQLIKQKYGKQCTVVSIMPCYDKKLQAIRFQAEEKIKQVDLTLATVEVVELIKKMQAQAEFKIQQKTEMIEQNQQKLQNSIKFIKDQSSNGYIEFILARLGITNYSIEQIKNADYKEYSFIWNDKNYKMAKCYGFRNIQKIVQMIKKDRCPYLYVEVMACPGGCFGGGGQIKYEGVKNKQIFVEFEEIVKKYPSISGTLQNRVNIENYNLDLTKIHVKYKPIEKTLTQAVLNW